MGSIDKIVYIVAGTGAVGFLGSLVLPLVMGFVVLCAVFSVVMNMKGKKQNGCKSRNR